MTNCRIAADRIQFFATVAVRRNGQLWIAPKWNPGPNGKRDKRSESAMEPTSLSREAAAAIRTAVGKPGTVIQTDQWEGAMIALHLGLDGLPAGRLEHTREDRCFLLQARLWYDDLDKGVTTMWHLQLLVGESNHRQVEVIQLPSPRLVSV